MNLVEWLQHLMTNFGATWVMWLLLGLSVLSVAIMLERGWFYWSLRDDIARLARELRDTPARRRHRRRAQAPRSLAERRSRRGRSPGSSRPIAARTLRGRSHAGRSRAPEDEARAKRLAFLGTLGNNAPFIGLFGTVIGVVQAFEELGKQPAAAAVAATESAISAPTQVMAAIAEALVATAVGLAVAIPAVAMYNYFQRLSRSILANTDALSHVLLSHLVAERAPTCQRATGNAELSRWPRARRTTTTA